MVPQWWTRCAAMVDTAGLSGDAISQVCHDRLLKTTGSRSVRIGAVRLLTEKW
nr:hypothetical protein [Kibdelosporangium sp. MJ126-NF4]CTQ97340.1 hypothetical protein [Kibdelosporangium sp. MJ126-NF4]